MNWFTHKKRIFLGSNKYKVYKCCSSKSKKVYKCASAGACAHSMNNHHFDVRGVLLAEIGIIFISS